MNLSLPSSLSLSPPLVQLLMPHPLGIAVPAHFPTKTKQISVAKGKQVHVQCNVQGDNPIDFKWKIQATQQFLDESLDSR